MLFKLCLTSPDLIYVQAGSGLLYVTVLARISFPRELSRLKTSISALLSGLVTVPSSGSVVHKYSAKTPIFLAVGLLGIS